MKKISLMILLSFILMLYGCGLVPGPSPSATPSLSPSASPSPSLAPSASAQPSAPASADEVSAADYFPLKENIHRTYKGTGNEYAGFESWVDYINSGAVQIRENNGGTESVYVYTVDNGAVTQVFSQGETYYRLDHTDQRTENEVLIKAPIVVGTSWQLQDGSTRSITATDTDVTVPYGSFKALEITTVYDKSTTKDFYVRDLGLVKTEFSSNEDPSTKVTSELENFEEGSPLNQNARFFYPDFNNNRLAYIDKSLAFYTGDNLLPKLEEAFKNAPAGSGLSPVMTAGASINSIVYDMASGVVTIDVTKTFITGMNAGTDLESMILGSIANTLGSYFQTDKVQLTVEGGPYESGHFLFNLGDYLPVKPEGATEYQG